MTRPSSSTSKRVFVLAALALLMPAAAEAQVRRGRTIERGPRWAPVAVGVRFGWDDQANGEVAAIQVRLPVVRSGIVEIVPNAEVIFPNQAKEYQYNVEAHYVPGGRAGGLFIGGGVGWRDTFIAPTGTSSTRSTLFGWVAALGGKTLLGPIQLEATFRWVFLRDTTFRPNPVSVGVSIPLWSARPR